MDHYVSENTVQTNVPQLTEKRLRNWFHWRQRSHSQQKDIHHVINKEAHRFLASKLWWPSQHTGMFPYIPYKIQPLRWNVPCSQTMVCTEISKLFCNPLLVTTCLAVTPNTTKIIFTFFNSKPRTLLIKCLTNRQHHSQVTVFLRDVQTNPSTVNTCYCWVSAFSNTKPIW